MRSRLLDVRHEVEHAGQSLAAKTDINDNRSFSEIDLQCHMGATVDTPFGHIPLHTGHQSGDFESDRFKHVPEQAGLFIANTAALSSNQFGDNCVQREIDQRVGEPVDILERDCAGVELYQLLQGRAVGPGLTMPGDAVPIVGKLFLGHPHRLSPGTWLSPSHPSHLAGQPIPLAIEPPDRFHHEHPAEARSRLPANITARSPFGRRSARAHPRRRGSGHRGAGPAANPA